MFTKRLKTAISLVCIVSVVFAATAQATDYNVGVTVGQWVKYGNFVGTGTALSSLFNQSDWMKLEVTTISGKNITLHMSGQYKNGTSAEEMGSKCNIETGWMNTSTTMGTYGYGYVIAKDLQANDLLPMPTASMKVNKTETRTYLGVDRTVAIVNITSSVPEMMSIKYVTIYDQASGILLELDYMMAYTLMISMSFHIGLSVTDTNIFGSTAAGNWLQDNAMYIAAGVIVIVVVVAGAAFMMRRKKTPATQTSTKKT
jgi:hypothetical protein